MLTSLPICGQTQQKNAFKAKENERLQGLMDVSH
jgi:hypothetical protein